MERTPINKAIASLIYLIRGQSIMLDSDLANIYGVETKVLNRAVKRNLDRFPEDFMFQLSFQEFTDLKRQIGTSRSWGGRRKAPLAFTEQGVAMLSSVLRSKKASLVNVQIIRTFVKMRKAIYANRELARKMEQLEYRMDKHDDDISALFEAIKQLMAPLPDKKKKPIGFRPQER